VSHSYPQGHSQPNCGAVKHPLQLWRRWQNLEIRLRSTIPVFAWRGRVKPCKVSGYSVFGLTSGWDLNTGLPRYEDRFPLVRDIRCAVRLSSHLYVAVSAVVVVWLSSKNVFRRLCVLNGQLREGKRLWLYFVIGLLCHLMPVDS
jgi:hypothetical protein